MLWTGHNRQILKETIVFFIADYIHTYLKNVYFFNTLLKFEKTETFTKTKCNPS